MVGIVISRPAWRFVGTDDFWFYRKFSAILEGWECLCPHQEGMDSAMHAEKKWQADQCCRQQSPPQVGAMQVTQRTTTVIGELVGHVSAFREVALRPQVTGLVQKILFQPGQGVRENEVLFIIDRRPYEANLGQARGAIAATDASRARATMRRCPPKSPRRPRWSRGKRRPTAPGSTSTTPRCARPYPGKSDCSRSKSARSRAPARTHQTFIGCLTVQGLRAGPAIRQIRF